MSQILAWVNQTLAWVCLQVSEGFGAWAVHWVVLKALMYALGTPSAVSFLELAAYAGYPFVTICLAQAAQLTLGAAPLLDTVYEA